MNNQANFYLCRWTTPCSRFTQYGPFPKSPHIHEKSVCISS